MALKSRLKSATFAFDGDTIELKSTLRNLEALREDCGTDFYEYLENCKTPSDMAKLFFHLQEGSEYTESEIYEAFFADLNAFQTPEFAEQLQKIIYALMGLDTAMLFKPAPEATQKKPRLS